MYGSRKTNAHIHAGSGGRWVMMLWDQLISGGGAEGRLFLCTCSKPAPWTSKM